MLAAVQSPLCLPYLATYLPIQSGGAHTLYIILTRPVRVQRDRSKWGLDYRVAKREEKATYVYLMSLVATSMDIIMTRWSH